MFAVKRHIHYLLITNPIGSFDPVFHSKTHKHTHTIVKYWTTILTVMSVCVCVRAECVYVCMYACVCVCVCECVLYLST